MALLLAACGGGGDGESPTVEGTREARTIRSVITRTDYPLAIYLPPASAGPREDLPVIDVLDGESWFETVVGLAESTRTRIIIVGIGTAGQRGRDFVPGNSFTPNGGGNAAYLNFIRQELIPYVQNNLGGHPEQSAQAQAWERDYAAAHRNLPVRLHVSYATQGNFRANEDYAAAIAQDNFADLDLVSRPFSGTHNSIVPHVLNDVLGFAFVR